MNSLADYSGTLHNLKLVSWRIEEGRPSQFWRILAAREARWITIYVPGTLEWNFLSVLGEFEFGQVFR